MVVRGILGSIGINLFFEGMQLIPTAITTIILNMKGIVILLFSMVFLGDRITLKSVLCILLCFLGAVLIVKPSLVVWVVWADGRGSWPSESADPVDASYLWGCYLIIIMCLFKSGINIWVRKFGSLARSA